MKIKKSVCLLLALIMAVSMISMSGCGSKSSGSGGKDKVVVALWGAQLLENYTEFLCKEFPDVDFEFVLATNSTDYYRYLNDHDDLPDIMTVRRFSLKDAVNLKDMMYDLGDSDLASTFYGSYLESYTYDDGTVNWLPACADVDSIIINETLFKEHNIAIPTDYDSFVKACEEFEKIGIQGFASDFGSDYTCMEVLQGFSIPQLLSMEGREWRQKYESGKTDQLSEEVWMPVFEKFFDLKDKADITSDQTDLTNMDPVGMYMKGELAMYRGTGTDVIAFSAREGDKSLLLPYFGNEEDDNWYLTYPSFHVGASREATADPEREKLIMDIMTAMLSQEGQSCITYGKNMIPYNKGVELELLPELDNIKSYIDKNKMYIRLASSEMFSISQSVVQSVINGEIKTPEAAFAEFNKQMKGKTPDEEAVAHIDTEYSSEFTDEHGNMAASAVYNTILAESGVDMVFGQSCYIGSDIYDGDYTETDLGYIVSNARPVIAELTGSQLTDLIEYTIALEGSRGAVSNDSTLYVSAGFEMAIARTDDGGYKLEGITKDGKELDADKKYKVMVCSDYDWYTVDAMKFISCSDYVTAETDFEEYALKRLRDGGQLETPTDYMTIK